ncbi:MAG: RHS repeat-associated core domain-containing protein, partial [Planctomycetota bacterium]
MTSVRLPSGVRNTMDYDPDGLRVKLEESTGTKKFVWDEQNYLAEMDENNDTQVVYTNEPRLYGNLVSQRRGSESRWYHFDAIGSTRELTDAAEVVTATRLYDAWGVPLASSGSTVFPFAFVGQLGYYDDAESLLRYVRARLVAASTGRWTSSDPLKAIRTYTYADNQPTVLIDPSGLVCVDDNPEACCCCVEGMSLRDVIEITRQDREQGLDYF